MRIGIVIRNLSGPYTGVGRFITSIMDALQQIDQENTYFILEKVPTGYMLKNKNWKKIAIPSKIPGIIWLQWKIPLYCKKLKIDILWVPEQICPLMCMGNIKIISMIYDLVFIHYPQTVHKSNLRIMKFFIPLTLKRAYRVTTISNYVKADIERQFPFLKNRIDSIFCGYPDWKKNYNLKPEKRGKHLFFAGNFEPRKNLLIVFKALEILVEKDKEIALHIGGPPGWNNEEMSKYLENSSIKDHVKILGYLSEQQLIHEFLRCKAFIYPSLYEGFGLPVLEALLMECPVITSKGTVMEEIAENAVLYCDPLDPQDIADKIRNLENYSIPKFNIQKVLLKYSWHKTAQMLLNTFNS